MNNVIKSKEFEKIKNNFVIFKKNSVHPLIKFDDLKGIIKQLTVLISQKIKKVRKKNC